MRVIDISSVSQLLRPLAALVARDDSQTNDWPALLETAVDVVAIVLPEELRTLFLNAEPDVVVIAPDVGLDTCRAVAEQVATVSPDVLIVALCRDDDPVSRVVPAMPDFHMAVVSESVARTPQLDAVATALMRLRRQPLYFAPAASSTGRTMLDTLVTSVPDLASRLSTEELAILRVLLSGGDYEQITDVTGLPPQAVQPSVLTLLEKIEQGLSQAHPGDSSLRTSDSTSRQELTPLDAPSEEDWLRQIAKLSPMELEVAQLVAGGATSSQVAAELDVSVRTVHAYIRSIYVTLGIRSRRQLPLFAAAGSSLRASDSTSRQELTPLDALSEEDWLRQMAKLSPMELEVAQLVAGGATNSQVAAELDVSVTTVLHLLSNIYKKLGIRSRTQLPPFIAADRRVR